MQLFFFAKKNACPKVKKKALGTRSDGVNLITGARKGCILVTRSGGKVSVAPDVSVLRLAAELLQLRVILKAAQCCSADKCTRRKVAMDLSHISSTFVFFSSM